MARKSSALMMMKNKARSEAVELSGVTKHHPGRNCKYYKIEAGDKDDVQFTDAIPGPRGDRDEADQNKEKTQSKVIGEKSSAAPRHPQGDVTGNGRRPDPAGNVGHSEALQKE